MVDVFRLVRELLRDDGTLWLNLGDSYAGSWGNAGHRPELDGTPSTQREKNVEYLHRGGWDNRRERPASSYKHGTIKPKDLCGIPWAVAFALQADGWYLRSDIIWSKPNPMPESVTDRPTKAHEYLFLLSKNSKYYFDQEAVKEKSEWFDRDKRSINGPTKGIKVQDGQYAMQCCGSFPADGSRNIRSVWTIPTQPTPEAHFATFPEALIVPCIKAGTSEKGCCPKCGSPWERITKADRVNAIARADRQVATGGAITGGVGKNFPDTTIQTIGWQPTCKCGIATTVPCTVLDPFFGSGTTGKVCIKLARKYIGCELQEAYRPIIQKRTAQGGLFT
jgi:hypothetical protein